MEGIVRTVAMFALLMLLFRVTGRRTLGSMTSFDFVVLLIISEATQQAMVGDDPSLTNAALVASTLLLCNVGLSLLKVRSAGAKRVLEGVPTLIVAHGTPLRDRLERARVDEEDVLSAARETQGLERMEQVRFAVLEANGRITVVPEPAS
jgi:uncharacterized membrane protein YcaP (DUF421 family)